MTEGRTDKRTELRSQDRASIVASRGKTSKARNMRFSLKSSSIAASFRVKFHDESLRDTVDQTRKIGFNNYRLVNVSLHRINSVQQFIAMKNFLTSAAIIKFSQHEDS